MKYIIESIQGSDVTIILSDGPVAIPTGRQKQTIGNMPVDDKDALQNALETYTRDFFAGLQAEQVDTVAPDVQALKGKAQTVSDTPQEL